MLKIRVQNVASFQDSNQFEIKPGINAFIGINNSGKSALLWALAMLGCAMRDQKSSWAIDLPNRMNGYRRGQTSPAIQVECALPPDSRDAIIADLCNFAGVGAPFPPQREALETVEFNIREMMANRTVAFVEPVRFHYNEKGQRKSNDLVRFVQNAPHVYAVNHPFGYGVVSGRQPQRFQVTLHGVENGASHFRFTEPDNGVAKCWPSILNSVSVLTANRDHTARYAIQKASFDLKPNAENLVQVLRTAQGTTRKVPESWQAFKGIEMALRTIFPEIKNLRAEVVDNEGESSIDVSEIVLDLTAGQRIPLSNSGSGVFQIVTLLTAAHLKPDASLFLIDEPHPYLHPAAERGLLRVLEQLAKERGHIFCLATHSSIISSQSRKNLFAVINRGDDSKVVGLQEANDILAVLGITNLDLFTYDKILFVEGESDADVFSLVLAAMEPSEKSERTKIVELSGDGKLRNTRGAHRLKELLISASASKARVPVGFLLDSSGRSEQQKLDLTKSLNRPPESVFRLLKKPELEDYLLEPKSVIRVLEKERSILGLPQDPDLEAKVTTTISAGADKGSAVLEKCFSTGIEGREYRKRDDSPMIASEILATEPMFLRPLYDELSAFIESIGR